MTNPSINILKSKKTALGFIKNVLKNIDKYFKNNDFFNKITAFIKFFGLKSVNIFFLLQNKLILITVITFYGIT